MNKLGMASAFILSVGFSFAAFADDCTPILEQGIRNTYQLSTGGNFESSMKSSFCNSAVSKVKNKSSGGFNLGVVVEGVPLSFGADTSSQKANDMKSEMCSDGASSMKDSQYVRLLQSVADKNIVAAWSLCNQTKGGVILEGDALDDSVTLRLRFRNVGPIHSTVMTSDPQIIGATCEKMSWKTGHVVTGSEQMQYCERLANKDVVVIINTEFNGAKFYLPKPVQFEVVPDVAAPSPTPTPTCPFVRVCYLSPTVRGCPAADQTLPDGASCNCGPPAYATTVQGKVKGEVVEGCLPAPGGGGAGGVLKAPGS